MLRRQHKQSPRSSKSGLKRTLSSSTSTPASQICTEPEDTSPVLQHTQEVDAREAALEEDVLGIGDNVVEAVFKRNEQQAKKKRKKKKPDEGEKKWVDSDDEQVQEFETVTPSWAATFEDENSDVDSDEEALRTHTHTALAPSVCLPVSGLDYKRVADGNKDSPSDSSLYSVEFHPRATVLMTGGVDNTVSLFAVDGSHNRKIHSVFLERTPVMSCHFSRGGAEIVIGSKHKSFYIYDLQGNAGVTFRPKVKGLDASNMSNFIVSPDGRFLAFLGSYGHIHLFSQQSHELIDSLRMNEAVKSVCFSSDGHFMFSFGCEGLVYVWDMGTRDCVHKFRDQGCVHGSAVAASPDGRFLVCGSQSGMVNIYSHAETLTSRDPNPLKLIKNLTTSCDQATFNCSSEILALRSGDVHKAVKLIHTSSMTVLGNFPDQTDHDLRLCRALDFSPSSGYLALGTHKGKCLLYRLQHYHKY